MDKPILFYDDYCAMCNWIVQFVLKIDKKGVVYFAGLDSETAVKILDDKLLKEDTVIFYDGKKSYIRSEAVFQLIKVIGGIWKVCLIGRLIPLFIRDKVYKWIAKNRISVFGKAKVCPMLPPNVRKRFLG